MPNNTGAAKRLASGRKPEDPAAVLRRKQRMESRARALRLRLALAEASGGLEAVQLYHTEKAKAQERWARNGGPSCGLTSGRRPLVRSA
ncbi:MAG TPA: hypothetical protein VN613_06000 [Gemmatimonadaceae bacterium]|nr:hypothetical protein [Gemmatimonadaceae bacterium]